MGAEWWDAVKGAGSKITQAILKSFKNDTGKQPEGFEQKSNMI